MDPARQVFQENPDFVEYVRRLINVPLKDILYYTLFLLTMYMLFSNLPTDKYLAFLFILVASRLCTRFILGVFMSFWSYNLNLTVGTILKKIVDND